VDVTGAPRWDIGAHEALSRDVAMVSGEPRALHLHVDVGADPGTVAARWQDFLGDHAVVLTRDEARDGALFGEMWDDVATRIGDVVVATSGRATIVDSRVQSPKSLGLIGVHGSLTPEELVVPLLMAGSE